MKTKLLTLLKCKIVKKIFLFLALFVFTQVNNVWSHPHVFIEYTLDFKFNKDKTPAGFWVTWEFGEMFSSSIIEGCDKDKNGKFSKNEITFVRDNFFNHLKNYNYYLHINNNGKIEDTFNVKDFSAEIFDDDFVRYKFFVPLKGKNHGEIVVSIFDVEYYCSIEPKDDNPCKVIGNPIFIKSIKVVENEEESFYFDQIIPEECHLEY